MKAVLCPVCNGKGVVYVIVGSGAYPTTICRGCNGKGWVEVAEDRAIITARIWNVNPYVDKCPACGGDRSSPAGTGCPMGSHYGTYC